jgi:holo-[acyl-carrier protein] synthase
MMGVDILNKERIKTSKQSARLARRILSIKEYEVFNMKNQCLDYLARRFCAKEAVSKALKTGIRQGLSFRDIEILNDKNGCPYVLIFSKPDLKCTISISDEKNYCIAVCLLTG